MIRAVVYAAPDGSVCGFKVENHGGSYVCAAVSMLCFNAVNSLELLTKAALEYARDEKGGYLECVLPGLLSGERVGDAGILINSLALGLDSAAAEYGQEISVTREACPNTISSAKKRIKVFKR